MADGLVPAQVTTADLYRELVAMREDLRQALTRLTVMESRNGDADKVHTDHETRIRALEKFRWQVAGALVLVAGIGAWAGYLAGHP